MKKFMGMVISIIVTIVFFFIVFYATSDIKIATETMKLVAPIVIVGGIILFIF